MVQKVDIKRSAAVRAEAAATLAKAALAGEPAPAIRLVAEKPKREETSGKASAKMSPLDATPERLLRATEFIAGERFAFHGTEDGAIERAGERPMMVRRFRDSQIDRARAANRISYTQWFAADWYRTTHANAGLGNRVTANYDITASGAGGTNYGLPRTHAQLNARLMLRHAHMVIDPSQIAWLHRVIVEDDAPHFTSGHVRRRFWERIGRALQPLALLLHAPDDA